MSRTASPDSAREGQSATDQGALTALDLTVLRYFRAIAQAGTITAAAHRLRISQPALSVAIRRLEAALGTSLFVRRRDGVAMTATGKELLAHANDILMSVHRAEQAIASLETEDVGRFVIGCPDVLGAYFLPEFLRRMFEEAPKIELALWNGSSRQVERAVLDREVDLGLVARFFPNSELVYVDLFSDTTALLVLGEPPGTLREARKLLRRGPLTYVEGLPQEAELLRALTLEGLLPEKRLTCGTTEMVKSIGLAGMGVVILPRRVAAYGQEGKLRLLHPSLPSVRDQLGLVYRADWHRTRAGTRVKDALVAHGRTCAKELDPSRREAR